MVGGFPFRVIIGCTVLHTIMDRSDLLHSLFAERARSRPRVAIGASGGEIADPFSEAFAAVHSAAHRAIADASRCIVGALGAMSRQHGAVTDIDGAMMVADAELASVSASSKAFHDLMVRARLEVAKSGSECDAELVAHYASASTLLTSLVDGRRLDLTICREELEAYKAELSASASMWLCMGVTTSGHLSRTPAAAGGRIGGGIVDGANTILSSSSNILSGVAEDLLSTHLRSAAETTDKVATALSSTVLSLARRTARRAMDTGASSGISSPPLAIPASPTFVYSEEEQRSLEAQRVQMLMDERTSNSASAKDIEATISDLAQLASMMQARISEQDEQLEGLERTATEATVNISKATEELKRPLRSSWSATMQMTLLLWILSVIVLAADFIVG